MLFSYSSDFRQSRSTICTRNSKRPRKIDVQRLRNTVKKRAENILMKSIFPRQPHSTSYHESNLTSHTNVRNSATLLWVQYHTVLIIVASILLKAEKYLFSCHEYKAGKENRGLHHTVQECVDGICSRVVDFLTSTTTVFTLKESSSAGLSTETVHGLLLMWPLYSAQEAPGVSIDQRGLIKRTLWSIGVEGQIPKAMALIRVSQIVTCHSLKTSNRRQRKGFSGLKS